MTTRHAAAALTAVTTAILLAACGGSDAPSAGSPAASDKPGPPGRGVTIAVVGASGVSLDPAQLGGNGPFLHQLIYDPLVNVDARGEVVSGLATKWSGDARKLTFTLRRDATCADGSPVTPSLVKRNFKRMEDPSLVVAALQLTTNEWTVTADDAKSTVTIELAQPFTFFLQALSRIYIVCPEGLGDTKLLTREGSGSGPFVLAESTPDERYVLERREGYKWGPANASTDVGGFPSGVTVRVVPNETTTANLLLGGDLDIATFEGPEVQRMRAASEGRLRTAELEIRSESLLFNQAPNRVASDPAVRRALGMILDRAAFAKVLTGDFGGPATGVAGTEPLACPYDVTEALPKGTVDTARQLLAEAGWRAGSGGVLEKDGERLVLQALLPPEEAPAFEYLQGVWQELGVELVLNPQPTASINKVLIERGDWDVSALYPPSRFPSAVDSIVSGPSPPDGNNVGMTDNAEYDRMAAAAKKLSGSDGCDTWAEAERALYSAADIVPMAQRQALWAWNEELTFEPQGSTNLYVPTSLRAPSG